jgi:hypothetical protein
MCTQKIFCNIFNLFWATSLSHSMLVQRCHQQLTRRILFLMFFNLYDCISMDIWTALTLRRKGWKENCRNNQYRVWKKFKHFIPTEFSVFWNKNLAKIFNKCFSFLNGCQTWLTLSCNVLHSCKVLQHSKVCLMGSKGKYRHHSGMLKVTKLRHSYLNVMKLENCGPWECLNNNH